jgi:hypothetical protein
LLISSFEGALPILNLVFELVGILDPNPAGFVLATFSPFMYNLTFSKVFDPSKTAAT